MKSVKSMVAGLAVVAVAGGGLLLGASGAHAAGTVDPAITNDPNASNGTIAFYNAAGTHIYSGALTAPFAKYAVASSATTRTGTSKASLFIATPDHTKADSLQWFSQGLTAASVWPTTTAPANINAAGAGVPVVTISSTNGDGDLAGAFAGAVNDSTTGYDHVMQVRLEDSGPGHGATAPFWAADLYIDTAAGTWTQLFPTAPALTATSISGLTPTPASPAPSGTTSVSLAATLTAADGTHPAGTVELFNGSTDLGAATLNAATGAITATATVADSTSYAYTFSFTPSGNYQPATSAVLNYSVKGVAAATTTVVSGPTTTTVGSAVTIHADVKSGATPAAVPAAAGSVQFSVNGAAAGSPVPLTATGADFSYNPGAAGSATITAAFVPSASQNYAASQDTTGVTVTASAPQNAPDPQDVVVTVPAGTLVISTPYTPAHPFNLGTMTLDAAGTGLTASAPFGSASAPAATDPGAIPAASTGTPAAALTNNGVTITDTRAGSTGWTASAQTSDFTGPTGNTTPIPGNNLSFTGVTPKYIPGNHLQAGSVTPSDITAFHTAKKPFATTTQGPGTVNITGTLGLTAATSTLPGLYTGTVTFTIV